MFDGTHPHLINGSRDPAGIERYWLDVALHECVHQYCHEVLGKPENAEKGHGRIFAAECSRISTILGIPCVGPARTSRNPAGLPSCAYWPSHVRPDDYYQGAYRPDLAPRRGKATTSSVPDRNAAAIDSADDADDDADPAIIPPARPAPLQATEWQRLFAAVRDLAVANLVERLAAYHGEPVVYPATTPAAGLPPLPAAPALSDEQDAAIMLRLPDGFLPSTYQLALFRFILFGQGDGLVAAVAASGKTTSLELAARLTSGDGLFLAFNKHIAEELRTRLHGTRMQARTIHSVGYATLRQRVGKLHIDDRKYRTLAQQAVRATRIPVGEPQRKTIDAVRDLANLSRLTLTDVHDQAALAALIAHFAIEIDPARRTDVLALLPQVLAEGERLAETQHVIDYTDQLYLCYRWQLQPAQFQAHSQH